MITLLVLPDVVLDEIFSFLTYDETAQLRVVCKHFNNICKKRLNKGFILAEKFENKCLKSMKSQLPRRESERRNHPLARHCDILSAIETRISMMSMTFNKYIETDLACFIPGKSEQDVDIIDEENSVDDVNKPDEPSRSKVQILVPHLQLLESFCDPHQ